MNLMGLPPMGQKQPKPEKTRKPVRKISRKRAAYLASPERQKGKKHMAAVAMLRCLVCGTWPVECHHEGKPRSDMRVLPLCAPHHRREFCEGAYHYSPRAFYEAHGSSQVLLDRVNEMLRRADDSALGDWF